MSAPVHPVRHSAPKYAPDSAAAEAIAKQMGDAVIALDEENGEVIVTVKREAIVDCLKTLRDTHEYQQLMDIAGADYPARAERFDVVYMLLSVTRNQRIMVKLRTAEGESVPSVTPLWPNAGWLEREVFDMFGVVFSGNNDLRRILTDYGFEGHPFRKDFPLTGYVELRYSEEEKRVVYEPVELPQNLRQFDFLSPWEGPDYVLPGDEKAGTDKVGNENAAKAADKAAGKEIAKDTDAKEGKDVQEGEDEDAAPSKGTLDDAGDEPGEGKATKAAKSKTAKAKTAKPKAAKGKPSGAKAATGKTAKPKPTKPKPTKAKTAKPKKAAPAKPKSSAGNKSAPKKPAPKKTSPKSRGDA